MLATMKDFLSSYMYNTIILSKIDNKTINNLEEEDV